MATQGYEELCAKILKLDSKIRAAAFVDVSGDKVSIKIREDVVDKKLVPLGSMPRWGHILAIVPWSAAENLERYFGASNELLFRFEKIDFCLMRFQSTKGLEKDKLLILTVEKGCQVQRLMETIRETVEAALR